MAAKKSLLREIESKNRETKWWHHRVDSIGTVSRMLVAREDEFNGHSIMDVLATLRKECEVAINGINLWFDAPVLELSHFTPAQKTEVAKKKREGDKDGR